MNPHYFDLAFLAIVVILAIYGASKGAVKVIAGLFGTIIGWIAASKLCAVFVPYVSKLLEPFVTRFVESTADSIGYGAVMDSLVSLGDATAAMGESIDASAASLASALEAGGVSADLTSLISKLNIAKSLAGILPQQGGDAVSPLLLFSRAVLAKVSPVVTFIALFLAIKLIIWLVSRLFSMDIPVLSSLNRFAGGLCGMAGGIALVLAICFGIAAFGNNEADHIFSRKVLAQSVIGGMIVKSPDAGISQGE